MTFKHLQRAPKKIARAGFSMIEAMLVLALAMGITTVMIQRKASEAELTAANATATHMQRGREGVEQFLLSHYKSLSTMSDSACLPMGASPCKLSLAGLYADQAMTAGYLDVNEWGTSHEVWVKIEDGPNYGALPGQKFKNLTALITTIDPPLKADAANANLLGAAIHKLGAFGGRSLKDPATGNLVAQGFKEGWKFTPADFPNITKDGQLAAVVAYGPSGYAAYIRRDGALPFTASQSMGGKNLTEMALAVFSGLQTPYAPCLTPKSVGADSSGRVMSCLNGRWAPAGTYTWREPAVNFASLPVSGNNPGDARIALDTSRAFFWDAVSMIWKPMAVDQDGNLSVPNRLSAGTLRPTLVVNSGDSCAPSAADPVGHQSGEMAQDANGRILTCQNGTWGKMGSSKPRNWQTLYIDGQIIYKCSWQSVCVSSDGYGTCLAWDNQLLPDPSGTLTCPTPTVWHQPSWSGCLSNRGVLKATVLNYGGSGDQHIWISNPTLQSRFGPSGMEAGLYHWNPSGHSPTTLTNQVALDDNTCYAVGSGGYVVSVEYSEE